MFDEAIPALQRPTELSDGHPLGFGWLGLTMARSGNTAEARGLLERFHALASQVYILPTAFAAIHLGLGGTDDAFTWLDRAFAERDAIMMPIKSLPFLDPLRSDPRFLALLRTVDLDGSG